jgi:ribosomal protein S18 acetylase RimI-like enzyme
MDNRDTGPLRIVNVTSTEAPLWPQWLAIYHESFPPEERMSLGWLQEQVEAGGRGEDALVLIAGLDHDAQARAIAAYEHYPRQGAAALWYLAVQEHLRGHGLGQQIYAYVRSALAKENPRFLFYEVEIPGLRDDPGDHARRRIAWYRRLGALQLHGIRYTQQVDTVDTPLPMHLLVHPYQAVTAEEVYESLRGVLGDALQRDENAPLRLE